MRVHSIPRIIFSVLLIVYFSKCQIIKSLETTSKSLSLEDLSLKGNGNNIQPTWIELEGDLNVKVSYGVLKRFWFISPSLVEPDSAHFGNRIVEVWLPPSYDTSVSYPVIYFNDGQMLFDANSTWNGQEWEIDETMKAFIESGNTPYIIVGIYNAGKNRHAEYLPEDVLNFVSQSDTMNKSVADVISAYKQNKIYSNEYLDFIVNELRPMIEENFSVNKNYSQNFIAGSSMGGLISFYACMKYRDKWGGMIALSSHWPVIFSLENNPFTEAFLDYTRSTISLGHNQQIWYLSTGTETLDSMYLNSHDNMVKMIKGTGKIQTKNFKHQIFSGMNHTENAWSQKFPQALDFIESRRVKTAH